MSRIPPAPNTRRHGLSDGRSSIPGMFRLGLDLIRNVRELGRYWPEALLQIDKFIRSTLPIGLFIGVFSGIGSAIQSGDRVLNAVPHTVVVSSIFKSGIITLFPCILALVLAGKVGSAQAAEVGSMKISDQVDALRTLAIDPIGYLGWPRLAAAVIMVPVVTVFSDICSTLVFYLASLVIHPISPRDFLVGLKLNFSPGYMAVHMILKPALFGSVIAFFGFFYGLEAQEGAKGIGLSSTKAMVVSSLLIIALNGVL